MVGPWGSGQAVGAVFVLHINRNLNPSNKIIAIRLPPLPAEYLFNLIPPPRHTRIELLIRPSQLDRWARGAGFDAA